MESGNIASWAVSEGQEVVAGDVLAMIETDKVPSLVLSSFLLLLPNLSC